MIDDPRNNVTTTKNIYSRIKPGTEFVRRALDNLKTDDDMMVLNALCDLSTELSMANDNLSDDVNCQNLIKELIILFDRFYMLPEISSKYF